LVAERITPNDLLVFGRAPNAEAGTQNESITMEPCNVTVDPKHTTSHLKCEHLTKAFRHKKVVNDVDVEVRGGEVVGLLGPNGAGKTTIFYMIVAASNAEDLSDGEDVAADVSSARAIVSCPGTPVFVLGLVEGT
jgi:ABC-type glutathione transport system ATPase component